MSDFSLNKILSYSKLLRQKPLVAKRIIGGVVRSKILKQKPLRNIEIQITPDCNSKCVMCFSSRLKCTDKPMISPAEIKTFWNDCLEMGALCAVITGGEPFMRPDLFEIIAALQPKKTLIGFLTNCLTVTEENIRQLKESMVDYLQVSLDGLSAEENDKIRGIDGHFDKVMKVIEYAKKYKIMTSVSFTITHQNIHRLDDICKFAKENDLFLNPTPAVPVGNWKDSESVMLHDEDWKHLDKLIKKYPQMRLCFSLNYEGKSQYPAGREKFCLSPYGDVMGCSLNHVSFGNLRNENLKSIWNKMTSFSHFQTDYKYCRPAGEKKYIDRVTRKINQSDKSPIYYKDL
ncbi:radical SAM protein [Candidatus Kuenenbacteria bacterium]|nr:radical SAM protein [Candidatus Kuenenbacteria bacterium]